MRKQAAISSPSRFLRPRPGASTTRSLSGNLSHSHTLTRPSSRLSLHTHAPPITSDYTWLFGISCIFSFVCAFGIGANDVANSFASSVGAKALTMGQAILVAAVMEFGGAVLLGASVTDTIKGGITKSSSFEKTPDVFLYGFVCVMIAAAFWDNFACHMSVSLEWKKESDGG